MRKFNTPSRMAKLLAMLCKHKGLELIYLKPQDANMEDDTVSGRVILGDNWEKIEMPIPMFIYVNSYLFLHQIKVTNYLKIKTRLSINQFGIISKNDLPTQLIKSNIIGHLAIPTKDIIQYEDIINYIDEYKIVVMKPVKSLQGKNVYILRKKDN